MVMKLSKTTPYAKHLKKSPQLRGIFLNHKNRLGKTRLNLWLVKYFSFTYWSLFNKKQSQTHLIIAHFGAGQFNNRTQFNDAIFTEIFRTLTLN